MAHFSIPSASGGCSLEFFERSPADVRLPIERFKVKLAGDEVSAVARVYAESHPAAILSEMAANWRGWQGDLTWESPEGELRLVCSQSRTGNVTIRVALRSGPTENDWVVQATVMTEAGQLETLADEAKSFFGASAQAASVPA